jgi:ElaB/YqjD/DUF883 family membrane-anchored ribosome-binding protein
MANESITESFTKSAKHAGAAAADTFHDTAVAARKSANGMGTLADAIASDTQAGARQLGHAFQTESSKLMQMARTTIQDRPNLAVGVAAGVGIALGLVLSSRR